MISVIFKTKMPIVTSMAANKFRSILTGLFIGLTFSYIACNGDGHGSDRSIRSGVVTDSVSQGSTPDEYRPVNSLLVLPRNPKPGESFRILATGGENIRKAKIIVSGESGSLKSLKSKFGEELPYWRIDDFDGSPAGQYRIEFKAGDKLLCDSQFEISSDKPAPSASGVWKTLHGWDSGMEAIYSAWINALFQGCDENASWKALHEVTQNQDKNFLFNYLSLGEDDPAGKQSLIMKPDCADNPFFLRAYFAWKLGLPFGYHLCDRGSLVKNPRTGQWITNESSGSKTNLVAAFNSFLRRIADGVQSGTARTALDDETSDYYPVSLERMALRPGTVFADPYGHTLTLVSWKKQSGDHPGLLLSVDAQPDGTVGIKRFWKGNFLFNTSEVVGEPGFKAFRPISVKEKVPHAMKNSELISSAGFAPYSIAQRKMKSDLFYHTMDRLINPEPLNPETALLDQIQALHEQLMVRVTSVANGEAYFRTHPGSVIPMPSSAAGIFLAGGPWEDFSTPNRDLRLLIAMDAVLDFPDLVARSPEYFRISEIASPEQAKKKLQKVLDQKVSELSITYTRTNGSLQKLTLGQILSRRDEFEMAYNPNDGIEIRWGAPEKSDERATCLRHAPSNQLATMRAVRVWFHKRLHPPT
jgi:hypothetical protein